MTAPTLARWLVVKRITHPDGKTTSETMSRHLFRWRARRIAEAWRKYATLDGTVRYDVARRRDEHPDLGTVW